MTTNHAQIERAALSDLFAQLGPDASTLCEGWTTRDLAAHLVVRESRPDAALGIIATPFAKHGDKVRLRYAAKPYSELVAAVRSGPPKWSVMRPGPIDRAANTLEYFVHHEDVRRAQDGWEPRQLDAGLESELWKILSRMGKILARRAPAGIVLCPPGRASVTLKDTEPRVELHGDVGELVMFLEGRQRATRVTLDGPDDAAESLRTAGFGI